MSIIIYRLLTFFDSSSGCKRACAVAVLLSNIIATIESFIFQVLLIVFLMLIYSYYCVRYIFCCIENREELASH